MPAYPSLLAELEGAVKSKSETERLDTLRRVTDLFLSANDRFSEAQIAVFDNVIGRLLERVEDRALAELSRRLAPIDNAPIDVIRRLARNDEISVAGPVLTQSARLTTAELVDIANSKTQDHRVAISARASLDEELASVLVEHGEERVLRRLSSNPNVHFSDEGFDRLLRKSEKFDGLPETIALRPDLPVQVLRNLLARASAALRTKLLSIASPTLRASMQGILARLVSAVDLSVAERMSAARAAVMEVNRRGSLDDAAVRQFADDRLREEIVVCLELMTASKYELVTRALNSGIREAILILCKAADLKWSTAAAVLQIQSRDTDASALAAHETGYAALSVQTAQRTLRFWQVKGFLAR